jgi:hypothetical protein
MPLTDRVAFGLARYTLLAYATLSLFFYFMRPPLLVAAVVPVTLGSPSVLIGACYLATEAVGRLADARRRRGRRRCC